MIEQWQIYLTYHQWMGILPLKKRVYKSIYKLRQVECRNKTEYVWSLCYWYSIFQCWKKKFELHDMTGLSKSLFFVDLVFLTANLTLGDLIPPCHRRRNVDSTVFIELSTTGIHTNTLSTTGGRRGDRLLPW